MEAAVAPVQIVQKQSNRVPVYEKALALLGRREHARSELRGKLLHRHYSKAEIDETLDSLEAEGLLSDHRFCAMYILSRNQRGYGPLRISRELCAKQVAKDIVSAAIASCECDWEASARQCFAKRYGEGRMRAGEPPAKQQHYLFQRGFPGEVIARVLAGE